MVAARDATSIKGSFEHGLRLDVRDQKTIDEAVNEAVRTHGRIDVLVNNAGHGLAGVAEEPTDDDLRTVLDVNLRIALVGAGRAARGGVRR